METELFSRILPVLRQHVALVIILVLGLAFVIAGIVFLLPKQSEESITFESSPHPEVVKPSAPTPVKTITIDIEGAVRKPGVYTLPDASRMKDAVLLAGGLQAEADQDILAKSINLAQRLTDGSKIYIPFQGEKGVTLYSGAEVAGESTKIVNINTASLTELDSLPKVGAVTAQKIIDNRPYSSIEDLKAKKVVGASVYTAIESLVTTN